MFKTVPFEDCVNLQFSILFYEVDSTTKSHSPKNALSLGCGGDVAGLCSSMPCRFTLPGIVLSSPKQYIGGLPSSLSYTSLTASKIWRK